MKKKNDELIDKLKKENIELKKENLSLKKAISSKRYKVANTIANLYNELLPPNSLRRGFVLTLAKPFKIIKKQAFKKKIKNFVKDIGHYKKIIVISGIPWRTQLPQRSHHLADNLSKNEDILVLYYEPDRVLSSINKIKRNLFTINSIDILFELKNCKANKVFVFNNVFNIALESILTMKNNGFKIAYECIDDLNDSLSSDAMVNQKEVWNNIQNIGVDYFFSTADYLANKLKKKCPNKKIVISKNAVDIEAFNYEELNLGSIPVDFEKILSLKKKIIGFYGAIAPWLDYELINGFAKRYPELLFVFIGADYEGALSRLDLSLNNIFYLGCKKQEELPLYSVHFDCAMIPFESGDIAKSTSPIKLFEYMATGLPVVCTRDLTECLGYDYVYVSKNRKEFEENTLKCLNIQNIDEVKKKLLNQAKQNTWFERAEKMRYTFGM